jgi:hypothetical protein
VIAAAVFSLASSEMVLAITHAAAARNQRAA